MPASELTNTASSVDAENTGTKRKTGRGKVLSFFLRFLPAAVLISASLVFVMYFAPQLTGKPIPPETSDPKTADATATADPATTGTADATATETGTATADTTAGTTSDVTSIPVIIVPTDNREARMADAEKAAIEVESRLVKELLFLGYKAEKLTEIEVGIGDGKVMREVYIMHGKTADGKANSILVGEIYGLARSLFFDSGADDTAYGKLEATVADMFGVTVSLKGGEGRNIIPVPYISQEGVFPNGCEAVSATMLLSHAGSDITAAEFIDKCLYKQALRLEDGILLGPDPNAAYSGDPTTEYSGIGCYAPVIIRALGKAMVEGYEAINLTGKTLPDLCSTMIDAGIPVSVWGTLGMEETKTWIWWMSYDRQRRYDYPANEHCLVLVGYDSESYYFNDPYESRGVIAYPKEDCEARFEQLGRQAVAVVPAER